MKRHRILQAFGTSALAVGLLMGVISPAAATPSDDAVVHTPDGTVRGTVAADHRSFQGIPYAAPPVGELRWQAPQPATPWSGVRDATTAPQPCPQLDSRSQPPSLVGSEDCLFVNVDTPRHADGPLPVMVFLHGGGFVYGMPATYDPTPLTVPGRVIVVTVGYRLGALGFLDHPALDDPYSGNFGLADQQAALRWVRRGIAAFGGDPGNVTLWGESAGAFSTCAQLAAPGAAGLFHKAIVQSGPCGNALLTRPVAHRRGLATAAELGCADRRTAAECLRAKPFGELTGLHNEQVHGLYRRVAELPWLPVTGTAALPLQPLTAMRLGVSARVPLIHGGTRDEMRAFVGGRYVEQGRPVTPEQYPLIVRDLFGEREAPAVLRAYPHDRYPTPSLALATLLSDYGGVQGTCMQVPADEAARRPVYAYEFAEPSPLVTGDFPYGAYHGVDVPYFFDSRFPGTPPAPPVTDPIRALTDRLIGHWTRFAHTGDPGQGWAAYRDGNALSFTAERTGPIDLVRDHGCDFWRKHV